MRKNDSDVKGMVKSRALDAELLVFKGLADSSAMAKGILAAEDFNKLSTPEQGQYLRFLFARLTARSKAEVDAFLKRRLI